ncbi:S-layer homology domain-containing protein [Solibacillus daqui]|uniref:S-layer homology domain-containing protein n=1 Tax=Solibacillus daqui TaxID=2912187 RepID=UPI002365F180|nr:S-layer homology domain-containing protein [Solibacillus daqui]
MKKFSIFAALILVLQLVLPVSLSASAEDSSEVLNYLALGDSLAAGMNEKGEIGLGYADYIAQSFSIGEEPINYNKGFAFPGYTTVNVLNDIENNVTKPIYNLDGQSTKTATIQQAIKEAHLITLSVGANDILKNVTRTEAGGFSYDAAGVLQTIQQVSTNYKKIFDSIYALNPEVDIIVMGLYNPFPYLQDSTVQGQLNTLVTTINNSIKTIVEENEGIFSDVSSLIAENASAFLPNQNNTHLNEAGYDAVAALMIEDYFAVILGDLEDGFTEIVIEEAPFTDIKNHWGKDYIDVAYSYGIMKGNEDGTFKPNVNVTRAQAVSVIVRAFELEATNAAPFKDISQYSQDTQNEIAAAYEAGLIRENGGYFNPKGQITRAQLALMLMRLSNSFVGEEYIPESIAPFKDIVNFDRETQVAITFLYDIGVVDGTSATTFSPKDNLTRAQLAKILVLAMSGE